MVDSIKPSFGTYTAKSGPKSIVRSAHAVDSHSEEKPSAKPVWDRVERRKSGDRRRQSRAQYASFEMRKGFGRRKTDRPHPSIETKA